MSVRISDGSSRARAISRQPRLTISSLLTKALREYIQFSVQEEPALNNADLSHGGDDSIGLTANTPAGISRLTPVAREEKMARGGLSAYNG